MKIHLILALSVLLTACQTLQTKRIQENDAFIGKTTDDLILKWGVPDASHTLSNGDRVLQYSRAKTQTSGGGSYTVNTPTLINGQWVNVPQQKTNPVNTGTSSCRTLFRVGPQGQILSWSHEGNGCF